ncbi:hypothetical protein DFH07DRAFT_85951 [Mycena maculata]|uniref:MYND-type domain-containing protein n=1 Tax=Mycena maculata TaxID=230809 RepID=A0AAD7I9I8_9AGAR|nr:hypothetical protein DFH07DRAFT_85951 [Mycena maculata]
MIEDGSGSSALLAVFYIHLNPARIPPADADFSNGNDVVGRAWVSLLSIYRLADISVEAFLDLWPNLWKWAHFFQMNCDRIFTEEQDDLEGGICLSFISFLGRLPLSDAAIEMILATPKAVYAIARAWRCRVKDDDPDLSDGYPAIARLLLENTGSLMTTTIQEVVDGAGGTHTDLASLIVSHIDAILPGHTDFMTAKQLYLLFNIVDFITTVDDSMGGRTFSLYRQALGAFGVTLLPYGITRALTNVAYGLIHQNEMQGIDTLLRKSLILLIRILEDSRGYMFVREAFEAGLLVTIASCAALGLENASSRILLEQILPMSMVYYYDVQCLEPAFLQADPIIHCGPFQACQLVDTWRTFTTLARERIALVHSVAASQRRRACDNVKCGHILEKTDFQRCSRCLSFYYCSRECQRIDWRAGDHRKVCVPGHSFHLGEGVVQDLRVRERSFMRAVLAHDYETQKWTTVYPQRVAFMAANPGVPYFTLFDYRHGKVNISVHATSAPHGGAPDWDPFAGAACWDEGIASSLEWRNDIARASNSGGKLQLHVMAIARGARTRYIVAPLRTNNAQIHGILAQIAGLSPRSRDIPELLRGVELSGVQDSESVEIY